MGRGNYIRRDPPQKKRVTPHVPTTSFEAPQRTPSTHFKAARWTPSTHFKAARMAPTIADTANLGLTLTSIARRHSCTASIAPRMDADG